MPTTVTTATSRSASRRSGLCGGSRGVDHPRMTTATTGRSLLCIVALAGCTLHSKAERPRVALKNAAWLAGGLAVGGVGYAVIADVRDDEGDSGVGGPIGA